MQDLQETVQDTTETAATGSAPALDLLEAWLRDQGLTFDFLGFSIAGIVAYAIAAVATLLVAYLADLLAKRFIRIAHSAFHRTRNEWDDLLVAHNVLGVLSRIAPALVLYAAAVAILPPSEFAHFLERLAGAAIILTAFLSGGALLSAALDAYQKQPVSKRQPIRGWVQGAKIVLYFLAAIFIIAHIAEKSPWGIVTMLGGLTAFLLLIFRDTILGFVAGIQLATNNMVSKGDWIEMPKFGADGDVIDITINTVKVQNWDMTISTIPSYALISDSFKNWRGMTESGGRRIKRAICLDMGSIAFLSDEATQRLSRFEPLREYLKGKMDDIKVHNQSLAGDDEDAASSRRLTNIGTFRAYIKEYLRRHSDIHQNMTLIVRQLAPTPKGLPLEIYAFSSDQAWANYEGIQADIFDHLLAIAPEFGLKVFQEPSGGDLQDLAPSQDSPAE